MITTRRTVLRTAGGAIALAGAGSWTSLAHGGLASGARESELLDALPGKHPLIKRSFRPPNYESPLAMLDDVITPNDRFFVRWHLSNIPELDARTWQLRVGDVAAKPLTLTLEQLRREFEPVELVAVCQCAGNQRGLVEPHVPGVQWGRGAVGNARWRGARLRDVLARTQLSKEALEVAFNGADAPVIGETPDFVKSIPLWKALDENTILAYEMNGAPLPRWNGFPVRVVVPGWAATYWVKQLASITVLTSPFTGFWMSTGYRVPKGRYATLERFASQESETSTPITDIDVNSLITNVAEGERLKAGAPTLLRGIAWDSGRGVRRVEISLDTGRTWQEASLGEDLGRYSFRSWQYEFTPAPGISALMVRATNALGLGQPEAWTPNPSGYHNNAIQRIGVTVV